MGNALGAIPSSELGTGQSSTSFWGYGRSLQAVGWPEVLFIAAFLILLVTESVTVWYPGMNSHLTIETSLLKP